MVAAPDGQPLCATDCQIKQTSKDDRSFAALWQHEALSAGGQSVRRHPGFRLASARLVPGKTGLVWVLDGLGIARLTNSALRNTSTRKCTAKVT